MRRVQRILGAALIGCGVAGMALAMAGPDYLPLAVFAGAVLIGALSL